MTPIEAMARAIAEAGHYDWNGLNEMAKRLFKRYASAALTALAENVSEGMARAAVTVEFEGPDSQLRRDLMDRKKRDFRAMCAAAGDDPQTQNPG